MIRSMTGFGSASKAEDGLTVAVELKSVNYRFKEVNARMPRPLLYLEDKIKQTIFKHIQRGRLELFVSVDDEALISRKIQVDWPLLEEYMKTADELKDRYKLSGEITLHDAFRFEHVIQIEEEPVYHEHLERVLLETVEAAVSELCSMREAEGARLKDDCLQHIAKLEKLTGEIEALAPAVVDQYRERLESRLEEWSADRFDESRLLTEVALFADRSDITEEVTRLKSHFRQFRDICEAGGASGRKLDFLVQELNREANTIGSKANDHRITKCVVEMKSSIEKIKEQVQNIE
ncbi:YicC/YloC family endoribonuclease [Bacillus glycinifermentans]|uniref:YicC/YloC family endoribonuclease n=1 Tax=Bacillus glycinifermentans TaxID=1664069 RepID=UPI001FF62804|nr:YicC/YloC family endoribonuclease [Bacillus glycinifermentans]UOY88967.1 YicC family protein [Bacillus glycinifermentans]